MQTAMKIFLILFIVLPLLGKAQQADILISNGKVLDGTGNSWYYADVAVKDGKIIAIGKLTNYTATKKLDAKGLVVAPGFIDVHTHLLSFSYLSLPLLIDLLSRYPCVHNFCIHDTFSCFRELYELCCTHTHVLVLVRHFILQAAVVLSRGMRSMRIIMMIMVMMMISVVT